MFSTILVGVILSLSIVSGGCASFYLYCSQKNEYLTSLNNYNKNIKTLFKMQIERSLLDKNFIYNKAEINSERMRF